MTSTVTFNVSSSNGTKRQASFQVQDKKLVNCIFPNINRNMEITEEELRSLESIAARKGDMRVLEQCDFGAKEKLQQALNNGFGDYYDIKISADGKFFEVTIKDAGFFKPKAKNIKSDFGLPPKVLLDNNYDLMADRPGHSDNPHVRDDWDETKFNPGETLRLPVEAVTIDSSASGFWTKLIS